MLKNILKLNGVEKLSKNQQTSINGGSFIITNIPCENSLDCFQHGADRCYVAPNFGYGRCVIF
jgi:hypothetical protein